MINRMLQFVAVALLAGCATKPLQKPLSGPTDIPIESAANIRRGETVKAYPINRYVDPADRKMMHERHVVYRVEEDADWRTTSNATQQVLVGNTFTASRMERQPDTLRQEGPGIASQQRALNQRMGGLETAVVTSSRSLASQNEALARDNADIRETLQKELKERMKEEEATSAQEIDPTALQGEDRIRYLEENKLISSEDALVLREDLRKRGASREDAIGGNGETVEVLSSDVTLDENGQIQE